MSPDTISYVCAVGDCADPRAWSGIPFHFWQAARDVYPEVVAFRTNLERHYWSRRVWNLWRVLTGRGKGGYQYSNHFLADLESELPSNLAGRHVLSFNQTFPRARVVQARGGKVSYYIDAPAAALFEGKGLNLQLPKSIRDEAVATEAENYRLAEHIFVMARWAKADLIARWPELAPKIHVVLPGANIITDRAIVAKAPAVSGKFTLGIVGMDWKRKGLPLLVDLIPLLRARGVDAQIMVIGGCPDEYARLEFVRYEGRIDKRKEADRFIDLVASCDLGCLFSESEALGISVLEFLRCGVPVAGFMHEGLLDTLPRDAGLQFDKNAGMKEIADRIASFAKDDSQLQCSRNRAAVYAKSVTWRRTVDEIADHIRCGRCASPFTLWDV